MEKQENSKVAMPGPIPPGPIGPDDRTRALGIKLIKAGIELIEAAEQHPPWPMYEQKPKEE